MLRRRRRPASCAWRCWSPRTTCSGWAIARTPSTTAADRPRLGDMPAVPIQPAAARVSCSAAHVGADRLATATGRAGGITAARLVA
uniref:Uncharacterized protein n=1 Tax=Arundo donax TaxID=35708 RepID=A0A0A8ZN85_ARUDO